MAKRRGEWGKNNSFADRSRALCARFRSFSFPFAKQTESYAGYNWISPGPRQEVAKCNQTIQVESNIK